MTRSVLAAGSRPLGSMQSFRHLLILDNAESITAAAQGAVPHALSAEQQELKTLLSRLHGRRALVLIGSREPETWLAGDDPGPAARHQTRMNSYDFSPRDVTLS